LKSKQKVALQRGKFTYSFFTYRPEEKFALYGAFATSGTHKGHHAFTQRKRIAFRNHLRKGEGKLKLKKKKKKKKKTCYTHFNFR